MTVEQIFSISGYIAMAGWLTLLAAPWARSAAKWVGGVASPLLLSVLYAGLILAHWGGSEGGFDSLANVSRLFSNEWLLLAGWVHYLAFDLFVGSWEARDAQKHGIPHLMLVPCFILTFLFGPVGLLLYFAIRTGRIGSLSIDPAPARSGTVS